MSTGQTVSDVTVIGLGRMGAALAGALLKGNKTVTVWNRDATKSAPLQALGGYAAGSLSEAVGRSSIVIVCLSTYAIWVKLVEQCPPGLLAGKVIVQLSTGAPDEAEPVQALHAFHGAKGLDGAIFAFPSVVGTPHATIYLSGGKAVFEEAQDTLAPLGKLDYLGEAIQLSNALDSALLVYSFGSMMAFFQGAALAESAGLPIKTLSGYAEKLGQTLPPWIADLAASVSARDYRGSEATVETLHGVWSSTLAYGRRAALPDAMLRAISTLSQATIDAGYGAAEFAATYEAYRSQRSHVARQA